MLQRSHYYRFARVAIICTAILLPSFVAFKSQIASVTPLELGKNWHSQYLYSELPVVDAAVSPGKGILFGYGLQTVQLNGFTVQWLEGALYVTATADQQSIAALTAPALITDANGSELLLPAGTQFSTSHSRLPDSSMLLPWWHQVDVQLIPNHFLQVKLQEVSRIVQDQRNITTSTVYNVSNTSTIAVTTNAILQRIQTCSTDDCLRALEQIHLLPSDAYKLTAWQEFARTNTTVALLLAAGGNAEVLPLVDYTTTPQHLLLTLFACRLGNCSTATFDVLEKLLQKHALSHGFSTQFVHVLALQLQQISTESFSREHPYTFTQLQSVLRAVLEPYDSQLPIPVDFVKPVQVTEQKSDKNPVEPEVTVGIATEEEALTIARSILDSLGAMYTVNTSLTYKKPNVVIVDAIVLPSTSGERLFSFNLNVKAGSVSTVKEGDNVYPNTLWLEDFLLWLHAKS